MRILGSHRQKRFGGNEIYERSLVEMARSRHCLNRDERPAEVPINCPILVTAGKMDTVLVQLAA